MKHIKKFNESMEKLHSSSPLINFYNEYKSILDNNEDYEQGDEPSNGDLMSEIGDLINKYNITKEDIKVILDNYDCSFDINHFLQYEYDEWKDGENETLEDILNLLDIFDTERFIKYLKIKGYKIVKI